MEINFIGEKFMASQKLSSFGKINGAKVEIPKVEKLRVFGRGTNPLLRLGPMSLQLR